MYILFREFSWSPSQFYSMGDGEKIVVCGFLEKYLEEKKKETRMPNIPNISKGKGRYK